MLRVIKLVFYIFTILCLRVFEVDAQCISCTSKDSINIDLVWCHPFSGNVLDETGNGFDGSYNGTTFIPDRFGNPSSAVSFSGLSNSYIEINKYLPDMDKFSISFWVNKMGTQSYSGGLFWEGDHECGKDVYIDVGTQKLNTDKSNGNISNLFFNLSLVNNTWTHFVWVASPNGTYLYRNGVLVNSFSNTGNWVGNHYKPTYGCWNDGNIGVCGFPKSNFYSGCLDDVRLYKRALTANDVKLLYEYNPKEFKIDLGLEQRICLGDTVHINPIVNKTDKVAWTPTINISNDTIINPKFYPTTNQKYICKVSSGSCSGSDTLEIIVNNSFANAGLDKTICSGNPILLQGNGPLGCSYKWSPNLYISDTRIKEPTINPTSSITYFLETNYLGCIKTDTVNIITTGSFSEAGEDIQICQGDSIKLDGKFNGKSFTWFENDVPFDSLNIKPWVKPKITTKYKLVVKSAEPCVISDSIIVAVKYVFCDAGFDIEKCKDDTITLSGDKNPLVESYWNTSQFVKDSSLIQTLAWPHQKIKYILTCIEDFCVAKDTISISIKPSPSLESSNIFYACKGVDFTPKIKFNGSNWYIWSPNDGIKNITDATPTFNLLENKSYKVIFKDSLINCPIEKSVFFNLSEPKSIFEITPNLGELPLKVITKNKSINAIKYIWINEDATSIDSSVNINHTYNNEGSYTIKLVAFDTLGCTDTSTNLILTYRAGDIYVPNVFTPNGDGLNDYFEPVFSKEYYKKIELIIFNRWGEQIFETNYPGGEWWDGMFNNKPCQDEVYVFTLKSTNIVGVEKKFKGNFRLIR